MKGRKKFKGPEELFKFSKIDTKIFT